MVTRLVKSYTLPVELVNRVNRLANERYRGNRSKAVTALLRDALPASEVLSDEATKTT